MQSALGGRWVVQEDRRGGVGSVEDAEPLEFTDIDTAIRGK
jgi:hypothetical protein